MIYTFDILNTENLNYIVDIFDLSDFRPGETSSGLIKDLKNNLELSSEYEAKLLQNYVIDKLNKSSDFIGVVIPKRYSGILFSKYEKGMYYHTHNDTYSMVSGFRTDYSVTVFLNDPEEYDGGELVLTVGNQELSYKLKSGQCISYPTGLTHRVNVVKSGVRKVCVMWAESCIQDIDMRNVLADYHYIISEYGKDIREKLGLDAFHRITNINNKLMRRFGDFTGVI